MDIRNISPDDWDTLIKWGVNKDKDLLPKDGTGGLLVHFENIPIAAGFIYLTNSKLAFINDIIYDKDKDRYAIGDWKTNKRIYTKSFNNQLGTAKATSHLMDCNFIHYSLQLSMYKYILTKYYGLNIDKLFIIHLAELAYNKYDCDYLENEITDMLDEWKLSNGNIKLITKEE